jgi:RNA recognition motif-containing protein
MSIKLYVGNLSYDTNNSDLQQLFEPFGTVDSATVITDRDTGRSKGFGFVEMSSKSEGDKAIRELNGVEVEGRSLTVNEARPREERSGGGGFGGGGGSRGGSRGGSGGYGGGGRGKY